MRQLLVVAVLFGIVAAASWVLRPRTDLREGSTAVRTGRVRVGVRSAQAYRIVYRTQDTATDDRISERQLFVRRPFESRTHDGVTAFGRSSVGPSSFFVPPGPAIGDLRPDALLAEAVRDGYARERELRRVAGRLCRVFRIGAPANAGSLPPVATGDEPTDVCVDDAGLVLEEVTYDGDDVLRRRVARSVTEDPRIQKDTFEVDEPKGDPKQLGSVQELEDDSRLPGGTFWELPDPPKGFESRGRYAVVPAGQPGFSDPVARSSVISFVTEVWTDGPDVFVLEQGATQGAAPFADDPDAAGVKTGDLGRGELLYSMAASEVRVRTKGARFVRVRGTLPPSTLLKIARRLVGVEGGPLRLKNGDR
jgi:hypothetical protein